MSEMTLEHGISGLVDVLIRNLCGRSGFDAAFDVDHEVLREIEDEMATAIKTFINAHLTRAPVQVRDEDTWIVARALFNSRKNNVPMGVDREKVWQKEKGNYFIDAQCASATLSARLAQPVVADVENLVANLQSVRDRWIASTKHDGLDGDFDILLEAINYIKRSQPHPQAAQGGEAQEEAIAWMTPESIGHLAKQNGVAHVPAWNVSGDGRVPVYTHPVERAAVPDDIRVALDECRADLNYLFGRVAADRSFCQAAADSLRHKLDKVARFHESLSAAPPKVAVSDADIDRVAKIIADHIGHGMREKCERTAKDIVESLSAAPTLAGKERW